MPLTVFVTVCVLGCDFMIYVLFKWMYADRRRRSSRRRARQIRRVILESQFSFEPSRKPANVVMLR